MLFDPEGPAKLVTIKKQDIDANVPSPQSLMPKDLLKPLNEGEVLDMLACLLSRGNERSRMVRPGRVPRGRRSTQLAAPRTRLKAFKSKIVIPE